MTGETLKIDDRITGALKRIYDAAADLKPVYKNIGEAVASSSRARFRTQTDPAGVPWKALNPLYAKTKKGPSILTGETRDLSRIIWQLADDGVEVGSNLIYARIHNQGGEIRPKNAAALVFSMGGQTFHVQKVTIPQRQFLGLNAADVEEILAIVEDHFEAAIEDGTKSN